MRSIRDVLPPEQVAPILAYKAALERELPGQVARVVLFGSRARGDSRPDSDYDVAVFVRGSADRRAVRAKLSDAAYEYVLAGVYIRPIPLPADDFDREPHSELAENIVLEGVLVQ